MSEQRAFSFACGGQWLYGVASVPAEPHQRGVLIVVGGPQYRAGSHRQFTLLARSLAAQGIAAMRFDYRGMGDSEGTLRNFEAVDDDLRAAIDTFMVQVPQLREVVLWGLCDAASAVSLYAAGDERVTGLALLNPWVRTDSGAAQATLKHYYRARLFDKSLWKKLFSGRFNARAAVRSFTGLLGSARQAPAAGALPDRMHDRLGRFTGRVLVMLSGADLTAQEFDGLPRASPKWSALMAAPRITRKMLPRADHTCSRREWKDQVALWTAEWLRSW
ncbi:hydrolase 1, exosortase A system-associated [Massilia sp. PAMC28688]|uniref:hydrolase 1, exosortase A system-associated n=1 Tax=Massilia sp. PAMC28688 TaxID=2861283 RepID=UPI001C62CFE2|nr:hydrolase 1, exosortase A system-associated [Massilia sp. PAMC28688]QYF95073.1 hydrolase 1, exosortase A system-associated [Massilia sp. PAMC28688]